MGIFLTKSHCGTNKLGNPSRFRVIKNRDPDRYKRLLEANAISDPWGRPLN